MKTTDHAKQASLSSLVERVTSHGESSFPLYITLKTTVICPRALLLLWSIVANGQMLNYEVIFMMDESILTSGNWMLQNGVIC